MILAQIPHATVNEHTVLFLFLFILIGFFVMASVTTVAGAAAGAAIGTTDTFLARMFGFDDVRHGTADDKKNNGDGNDVGKPHSDAPFENFYVTSDVCRLLRLYGSGCECALFFQLSVLADDQDNEGSGKESDQTPAEKGHPERAKIAVRKERAEKVDEEADRVAHAKLQPNACP